MMDIRSLGFSDEFATSLAGLKSEIRYFNTWGVEFSDVIGPHPAKSRLRPSKFLNPGEGMIFSRLIERAVTAMSPGISRIIDLGCGSSLPTLSVLLGKTGVSLSGVDIDMSAVEVSRHNAMALGVSDRCEFRNESLLEFMKGYKSVKGDLITANPPYIPIAAALEDDFLVPISAGRDGLKFISPILEAVHAEKVPAVFLGSSLTSPAVLFKLLKDRFNVVYCEGVLVHFGKYLNRPDVNAYLNELRNEGLAEFGVMDGKPSFLTLGFVIAPR